MRLSKQKKLCKGCWAHWTHGRKDGKHNNWCCHYGVAAPKAISMCVTTNHYEKRNEER